MGAHLYLRKHRNLSSLFPSLRCVCLCKEDCTMWYDFSHIGMSLLSPLLLYHITVLLLTRLWAVPCHPRVTQRKGHCTLILCSPPGSNWEGAQPPPAQSALLMCMSGGYNPLLLVFPGGWWASRCYYCRQGIGSCSTVLNLYLCYAVLE